MRLFTSIFSLEEGVRILAISSVIVVLFNVFLGWDVQFTFLSCVVSLLIFAVIRFVLSWFTMLKLARKFGFDSVDALVLAIDTITNTIYNTKPAGFNTNSYRADAFLEKASDAKFVASMNNEIKRRKTA